MGTQHSTRFFYGAHVPREQYQTNNQSREQDMLDGWVKALGFSGSGLGHTTAGAYDQHELFLCVVPDGESCEVELGTFRRAADLDQHSIDDWSHMIETLAHVAGYRSLGRPGWIVAPTEC
jgi:hypothetical protein